MTVNGTKGQLLENFFELQRSKRCSVFATWTVPKLSLLAKRIMNGTPGDVAGKLPE